MHLLRYLHMFVAFSLELVMIATFARWGFAQRKDTIFSYAFAIAMALIVIVLWGIFAAPKSNHRLAHTPRILFETSLYAIATYFLYDLGHHRWAVVFFGIALLSEITAFFSHE